jgi:hypothetical protein
MNGPIFSASFTAGTLTAAATDIFELVTGATARIAICGIDFGQYSDSGDAAAELLGISIIRGYTTSGNGTSVTPANLKPWSRASTVTAEYLAATVASNGSPITVFSSSFNIQAGFLYRPKFDLANGFDERIWLDISSRLVVRVTAPADELTVSGTIWFQEAGLYAG